MADDVIPDAPVRFPGPGEQRPGESFFDKVAWGAIWAAVMVTVGMEALFLSFGLFIGGVFGGSAIWSMAWYLVTMAVSFYVGAWTAGRLSNASDRGVRILHGITTWGLATLTTVILVGTVLWAGLRIGTTIALNNAAAAGGMAVSRTAVWGAIEMWAGMIWGGIILSLITAYLGAASGQPGTRIGHRMPVAPRRAA